VTVKTIQQRQHYCQAARKGLVRKSCSFITFYFYVLSLEYRRRFPLQFNLIVITAARMRFFRARSLILSPSKKSIARQALPPRPALKACQDLRGSPVGKGKLHLYLCERCRPDHSVAKPHWASHPLPFLDDLRSASRCSCGCWRTFCRASL